MTIAKRQKGVPQKQTEKKVKKLQNTNSSFAKHVYKNREIDLEDEAVINPLLIHNILE